MTRHNIRQKKGLRPGQLRIGIIAMEIRDRKNTVRRRLGQEEIPPPVGHAAEDRRPGSCGRCAHSWERHHNVVLRDGETTKIGCSGGFYHACPCKRAGRKAADEMFVPRKSLSAGDTCVYCGEEDDGAMSSIDQPNGSTEWWHDTCADKWQLRRDNGL